MIVGQEVMYVCFVYVALGVGGDVCEVYMVHQLGKASLWDVQFPLIRIKHACHVWSNLDTVEVFPCLSLVFLGALVLCRPLSANTVY